MLGPIWASSGAQVTVSHEAGRPGVPERGRSVRPERSRRGVLLVVASLQYTVCSLFFGLMMSSFFVRANVQGAGIEKLRSLVFYGPCGEAVIYGFLALQKQPRDANDNDDETGDKTRWYAPLLSLFTLRTGTPS